METTSDSVIEEIRQSRKEMSELCGHDPVRYFEYLKAFNRKYDAQVERYRKEHGPLQERRAPVG